MLISTIVSNSHSLVKVQFSVVLFGTNGELLCGQGDCIAPHRLCVFDHILLAVGFVDDCATLFSFLLGMRLLNSVWLSCTLETIVDAVMFMVLLF
jgi:hypothetical protein